MTGSSYDAHYLAAEAQEAAWWRALDERDPKCTCGHRRSGHGPNHQTTYTICSLGACACERFTSGS